MPFRHIITYNLHHSHHSCNCILKFGFFISKIVKGWANVEQSDVHGYHQKGMLDSPSGNVRHYTEPETWRTWSSQRAGFQNNDFEGA